MARNDRLDLTYHNLAESVKAEVTRAEYAWLSEDQRANLEREITTPPDDAEDQAL